MKKLNKELNKGMFWSFAENVSKQFIRFFIGIILARLLSPSEFGLIGMVSVLIALGLVFSDGGFSVALIRKNNCNKNDYNTVFYTNLLIASFFYLTLYISAPYISVFYEQLQLTKIIRVMGIVVILNSINIIQRTILTKNIDFKLQSKITIYTSILSGFVGISLAYLGYGVWSLVFQAIAGSFFTTLFFWSNKIWKPKLIFSRESFKKLFAFGSNILITDIINTIHQNIYYVIIGKYFSPASLGFYTRANTTVSLATNNITKTIKRVSYPVLAKIKDNDIELKTMYKRLLKYTMLIVFTLNFGLIAVAKPFIVILIGEKWLPSVPFIQILSLAGIFLPLTIYNLNGINLKGNSRLYLKLQMLNKIMSIPVIIIGLYLGIKAMLLGFAIISAIYYVINTHYASKYINYTLKEQLFDLLPFFLISSFINIIVYSINFLNLNYISIFTIQIIIIISLTFLIYNTLKISEFINLKRKLISYINKK